MLCGLGQPLHLSGGLHFPVCSVSMWMWVALCPGCGWCCVPAAGGPCHCILCNSCLAWCSHLAAWGIVGAQLTFVEEASKCALTQWLPRALWQVSLCLPGSWHRVTIPAHPCLWKSLLVEPFSHAASLREPSLVSPSRRRLLVLCTLCWMLSGGPCHSPPWRPSHKCISRNWVQG